MSGKHVAVSRGFAGSRPERASRRLARLAGVLALGAVALGAGCASDGGLSGEDEASSGDGAGPAGPSRADGQGRPEDVAPIASGDGSRSDADGSASSGEQASSPDLPLSPRAGDGAEDDGSDGAGDSPADDDPSADQDLPAVDGETGIFAGVTAAHNAFRSDLGLPDLVWSDELARIAQDWADQLAGQCGTIEHSGSAGLGENIAARRSSRLIEPYPGAEAVAAWAAEVACWDYGSIRGSERCDAQCVSAMSSTGCGHYTQVVWEDTREMGCGYATCPFGGDTVELWVCNYDPPGNVIGQTPY